MWYKIAQQKVNMYGLPLSGKRKVKFFADDEMPVEENIPEDQPAEEIEEETDENGIVVPPINPLPDEEVTIDDPSNDDEFTPEDLQTNIKAMEEDPTLGIKLPGSDHANGEEFHPNCHCRIETLPILSKIGVQEGRRIWKHSDNACEKCKIGRAHV